GDSGSRPDRGHSRANIGHHVRRKEKIRDRISSVKRTQKQGAAMNKRIPVVLATLVVLVATSYAGKVRRDPLTAPETDELREVAQEPVKRLKLYVKYGQARMTAIEQLRSDPKLAEDRGRQIHDLLEDFTNIVDELDDNVDMYHERGSDLRKPL